MLETKFKLGAERGRALDEARRAWVVMSDLAIALKIQYEQTGVTDPRMMNRFQDLSEAFADLLSEREPVFLKPEEDPFHG